MRAGSGTSYFDNIRFQEGEFRTKFNYDTSGNYLTGITSPLNNSVSITPESTTGNILSYTDTLNNIFSAKYNMMNQITSFTYPYQGTLGSTSVNKSYAYSYDVI